MRTILGLTLVVVCLSILAVGLAPPAEARELTFEQRVAAQRAVEEVYWRHRIWPQGNPAPKPPLSAVMSEETIRAKVTDSLKKSNALETWWRRPVRAAHLQAELDRMARATRDPEVLGELYAALGNDPFLIAETLARPTLVERLIRNWYASDDRFHGAVRREAQKALAGTRGVDEMKALGGQYVERTFVKRTEGAGSREALAKADVVALGSAKWEEWRDDLARRFRVASEALPVRRLSGLQEDPDHLFVTAVRSLDDDEMAIATVVWPKRSFEAWWSEQKNRTSAVVTAAAGAYALTAPRAGGCVNDTWEQRFYGPDIGSFQTAVWTGTEMIVWGGWPSSYTGGRYDTASDSWTAITRANAPSANDHTAVWTGREMIVWGGSSLDESPTGSRYDPASDSWTPTSAGPNAQIHGHTAVWTGTEMIVWGGYDPSTGSYVNTGGRYKPDTNSWTATSTGANVPTARFDHTAVWTGVEMIVWGGGQPLVNTGGRYDPRTDSWTPTSTGANVPAARWGHTAVWTGSEMIVWGGGQPLVNTGGRYDPRTDSWTPTSTGANVPAARWGHTAVWTGSEMIVWGGAGNTGGRYDPTSDSWTPTSTGPDAPSARYLHTAVWTGTEMIIWGGASAEELTGGNRYDPATDTWATMSTTVSVPSPRQYHATVWTGTEMIVWGGVGFSSSVNSGGRYNPATDSWTPTPTGEDVPVARYYHTAVWSGTEMIVWGGHVAGSTGEVLNTGGRYDPMTDSWTATSTGLNVPGQRYWHTAVWTGTEMIVWGGSVSFDSGNTGGRYDPASDSWTPTSTGENVPEIRVFHAAVWSGTEMIVWGGGWSGALNTGGRYDPGTDSWTATSTGDHVPDATYYTTAVWTGTEMIVWGGGSLNAGGRYDPTSDIWTPTSTGASAPSAVIEHTAVWTGTEMIVWGAYSSGGGRYDPASDSWTEMSMGLNGPSGRLGHTAVWTGTKMAVWGGASHSNLDLYCAAGCSTDTDVDGVCDDVDACTDSILEPTVLVPPTTGACDSGVTNHLLTDGCSLSDGIAACDASSRNKGQFLKCVSALLNSLEGGGVITEEEHDAIDECAKHYRKGDVHERGGRAER